MADLDGFGAYYAERLWNLLPEVYRVDDTGADGLSGPLRELLDRIGAQVAVVRRSMDRLWADQSIETCDDWVVPYIGDLLGTNLVNGLARAQRVDVAKTIHYRRRKGTLAVLEELAIDVSSDVTSWDVHLVEGFRRLARTRHGLDPMVGPGGFPSAGPDEVAELLRIEGLVGPLTGTPAGGLADLRSVHGAALTDSPFDESFHMADLRRSRGALGHFGIPNLLVFLWRLTSFAVVGGTPVAVLGCPGQHSFDPTGRRTALFLPPPPPVPDDFADTWTSAFEWQVPGPISTSLLAALADLQGSSAPPEAPYPFPPPSPPPSEAPAPGSAPAYGYGIDGATLAESWPELGIFAIAPIAGSSPPLGSPPAGGPPPFTVSYHYGFSALIGAGPYNRLLLGNPPVSPSGPSVTVAGGAGLDTALAGLAPGGSVVIEDSLTYSNLAPVGSSATPIDSVLVAAAHATPPVRPVLRPEPGASPWVFTGSGEASLTLDGLLLSGGDVVLRGSFGTVRLTACTFDPGASAPEAGVGAGSAGGGASGSPPGSVLASAVDGRELAPTTIWIEADPSAPEAGGIANLVVEHCILGPIRTRLGGSVETVSVSDSIVQGLATSAGPAYWPSDVFDPALLAASLQADDPVADALFAALPATAQAALPAYRAPEPLPAAVLEGLNALVDGPSLYDPVRFASAPLSPDLLAALAKVPSPVGAALAAVNRELLDEIFPVALGVAAIALDGAAVGLERVTVLGRLAVQRLQASDTILDELAVVDDTQDGCVRFSAFVGGSRLPRQYESVQVAASAPIFTSTAFGAPGYAQLIDGADVAITGGNGTSISTGADSGSEMGTFSANLGPLKEQGILVKYAEYMPLGLTPVIVHVT